MTQAAYLAWVGGHHGFFLPPSRPGARWLHRAGEPFWFERVGGRRALYVQYNQVQGPELRVPLRAADYFADRDPVLAAALAHRATPSS